ncbi:hypothetical protein KR49_09690 [Synechococcus sp. KORDI-49]|nr:hypothetical protein KR49_09690 [Synechococcus sp. KORDI-49]
MNFMTIAIVTHRRWRLISQESMMLLHGLTIRIKRASRLFPILLVARFK